MNLLNFISIDNLHHELIPPWLDLYETAFPPEERLLVSTFWKILAGKEQGGQDWAELLGVVDEKANLAGMVFYQLHRQEQAAALWYLAIHPDLRSQGLGSQVYQEVLRRVKEAGCRAMIFEVEMPENAQSSEAQELARRRIRFYRHNGAKLLMGIHYLQSVGPHQSLTPMHLMFHPTARLDAREAFQLARFLFGKLVSETGPLALE